MNIIACIVYLDFHYIRKWNRLEYSTRRFFFIRFVFSFANFFFWKFSTIFYFIFVSSYRFSGNVSISFFYSFTVLSVATCIATFCELLMWLHSSFESSLELLCVYLFYNAKYHKLSKNCVSLFAHT